MRNCCLTLFSFIDLEILFCLFYKYINQNLLFAKPFKKKQQKKNKNNFMMDVDIKNCIKK